MSTELFPRKAILRGNFTPAACPRFFTRKPPRGAFPQSGRNSAGHELMTRGAGFVPVRTNRRGGALCIRHFSFAS